MQNYQQPGGYQRPGSTTSFAGHPAPPPPPGYGGASQGYSTASPQSNSQWAPPPPTNAPGQQQWNQTPQQGNWGQQQQAPGGYNPGTYGAISGGYGQTSQHQQDQPPPPPPKPYGFGASTQQQPQQNWGQQPPQPNAGYPPQGQQGAYGQQGQYQQHGGYPPQGAPQQQYNQTAPPPPSQTPGGSYFPPGHGRPGSLYGADQVAPASPANGQPPQGTVMSPNEQQPAYIPPSLTGQGVQSYLPANTNPQPGVYVPPPPDIPAWQQASHAPLQGENKKFKYTKPTVDPSFHGQGYQPPQQGQYGQPPPQPQTYGQPGQDQYQHQQGHHQHQGSMQPGQFVQPNQPIQQQFSHPGQQNQPYQQQPNQYNQAPQGYPPQQPQQYQQHGNQWQSTPGTDQGHAQHQSGAPAPCGTPQSGWQPGHQSQASVTGQQYPQSQTPDVAAPKPLGRTGTAPPEFFNQTSPQSPAVSPVHGRQSVSYNNPNEANLGRTSSVSSIALDAIRNRQSQAAKTGSPAPSITQKVSTPPPAKEAFSALGMGGPSDWEHFGAGDDEIDDEELFGAKREDKHEHSAAEFSAELPAHVPSPPPAAEWPTPESQPSQPAPLNVKHRDSYQPTPPPNLGSPAQRPPSQPPQQGFVMGDGIPKAYSPQPTHLVQPPPNQQGFVMNDGGFVPPLKQSTPVQHQQHPPAPPLQNYAMNEAPPRQQTPTQMMYQQSMHQQQAPPAFAMGDAPPPQLTQAQREEHEKELRLKDEAYERLKSDLERENADRSGEVERLKAELEKEKKDRLLEGEAAAAAAIVFKSHAADEEKVLKEQIESMKLAANQLNANLDALTKEKDVMIERLKEDAEGRDDMLKEKDAEIVELKRQLEAEKAKEPPAPPTPTAADLIPDIDPWYAGSLERYIGMLRAEAGEPQVEDKIKTFTGFLQAESAIRGLEYYSAPPVPPAQDQVVSTPAEEPFAQSRDAPAPLTTKPSMHVQLPQQTLHDEPGEYSPGGRPIFQRKATMPSTDGTSQRSSTSFSFDQPQQQAILTPTSSADDELNKTPTPVQSPPEEPQKYVAFRPSSSTTPSSTQVPHRASLSYASPPAIQPLKRKNTMGDEIFFGGDAQANQKPEGRPQTSSSRGSVSDIPMPAPLFTPKPPGLAPSPAPAAPKKNPVDTLNALLPKQISPPQSNPRLEAIRSRAGALSSDFTYITTLTTTWEKTATQTRKKNDQARQKRQEENEDHTNELFEANEISYQDIGDLEEDFKEQERDLKAKEDRDEYKSYVAEVFDKVYDGLQADIKTLAECSADAESLIPTSVSGIKALDGGSSDAPSTKSTLDLLNEIKVAMELRHENVVKAVAERDKKYKKTEVQPLYAAGDIKKMKTVEKHFETAEKQALVRARDEKADRIGKLVKLAEHVVMDAVGAEQSEIDDIIKSVESLTGSADETGRVEAVDRAGEVLEALLKSSKELLTVFNKLEIELNEAVLEAEIAQAKVEGKDARAVGLLQEEMREGEQRLRVEFERKVGVLERESGRWWRLLKEKGGPSTGAHAAAPMGGAAGGSGGGGAGAGAGPAQQGVDLGGAEEVTLSPEEEKKRRLQAALEEAKRRNGEL